MIILKLSQLIATLFEIYSIIVIANALLSWFVFGARNTFIQQAYALTSRIVDPVLRPIRNVIAPATQGFGIDISPFILIILLQVLARLLQQPIG